MNQIRNIMMEIRRLQQENYVLKSSLVKIMQASAEPNSAMHTPLDRRFGFMFSDDKGFEQFAGPDYGSNTRAERAGFMSGGGSGWEKFHSFPIRIGRKYFE